MGNACRRDCDDDVWFRFRGGRCGCGVGANLDHHSGDHATQLTERDLLPGVRELASGVVAAGGADAAEQTHELRL